MKGRIKVKPASGNVFTSFDWEILVESANGSRKDTYIVTNRWSYKSEASARSAARRAAKAFGIEIVEARVLRKRGGGGVR